MSHCSDDRWTGLGLGTDEYGRGFETEAITSIDVGCAGLCLIAPEVKRTGVGGCALVGFGSIRGVLDTVGKPGGVRKFRSWWMNDLGS